MNKVYQVTLFCKDNKYKPVSALVARKEGMDKRAIQLKGIEKICQKRYWSTKDLAKYGYTICKIRLYDEEKIEQEKKERFRKIVEEKYPKGDK